MRTITASEVPVTSSACSLDRTTSYDAEDDIEDTASSGGWKWIVLTSWSPPQVAGKVAAEDKGHPRRGERSKVRSELVGVRSLLLESVRVFFFFLPGLKQKGRPATMKKWGRAESWYTSCARTEVVSGWLHTNRITVVSSLVHTVPPWGSRIRISGTVAQERKTKAQVQEREMTEDLNSSQSKESS